MDLPVAIISIKKNIFLNYEKNNINLKCNLETNKIKSCNDFTLSVSLSIIVSTAAASAEDLYVSSRVRIAIAVSILTDEKSPLSSYFKKY